MLSRDFTAEDLNFVLFKATKTKVLEISTNSIGLQIKGCGLKLQLMYVNKYMNKYFLLHFALNDK